MAEKKESLFRKKSTEYLDSPEKLDQYLHVTSPGVWALLLTIIVLLVGVCAWCVLGKIEAHVEVAVVTNEGQTVCLVPQVALDEVIDHPEIVIDGKTCRLLPDTLEPAMISDSTNIYILLAGNLKIGDIVYSIPVEGRWKDGIAKGTITTETLSPISLLMN